MPVFDTHKAVKALTSAGFPDHQAEALVSVVGEEHEALATKADLQSQERVLRGDIQSQERVLRGDIQSLEQKFDARMSLLEQEIKSELRERDLRMRLVLGAYVFAAASLTIGVLLALEFLPR